MLSFVFEPRNFFLGYTTLFPIAGMIVRVLPLKFLIRAISQNIHLCNVTIMASLEIKKKILIAPLSALYFYIHTIFLSPGLGCRLWKRCWPQDL